MTDPQTVTRVVKTRMRHDGRRYRPGDEIALTPAQAARHEARGHVATPETASAVRKKQGTQKQGNQTS